MIEVYAIADSGGPPLPDVAPLRAVTANGLMAVCAPADEGEATPEALWRREAVLEALMEDRDLLPVRYGTRMEDEAAAARVVRERHDELARALDRVRGAVELSLRVVLADADVDPQGAPTDPAPTGADYLRARARSAAAHRAARAAVHEPLAGLARASTTTTARPPSEVLRAAYLVDRDAIGAFAAAVARLQAGNPRLRLLCTGPWPPFSFTEP